MIAAPGTRRRRVITGAASAVVAVIIPVAVAPAAAAAGPAPVPGGRSGNESESGAYHLPGGH